MSIAFVSAGAYITGINTAITPTAGSYAIGDAILYSTGQFFGSATLATPSGWNLLSLDGASKGIKIFGRIAQSTSETIPSIQWGANRAYAQLTVFRGVDSSFLTLATAVDRANNSTGGISMNAGVASTPSSTGCLVFSQGQRNKTPTTDGTVYTAQSGFTVANQLTQNGTNTMSSAIVYQIQTTAVTLPTFSFTAGSLTEGAAQSSQGTTIFLAPAAASGGGGGGGTVAFPPSKRRTFVFYDNYYPR